MQPVSTHRVVSARTIDLFTYPVGVWAVGLLFLYGAEMTDLKTPSGVAIGIQFGIVLCYPLAFWNVCLSIWWAIGSQRMLARGQVSAYEVNAGVRYIGHLLCGVSASPAIVFLTVDPLLQASWATCAGIGILCAFGFAAVSALTRIPGKMSDTFALVIACLILPINATGAASLGWWLGWFDPFLSPVFSFGLS